MKDLYIIGVGDFGQERLCGVLNHNDVTSTWKIIDSSVILSKRIAVGEGTIICAGTIATVDISIGKHVIINLDYTLGHDDVIEDFMTIYPSVKVSGNGDSW